MGGGDKNKPKETEYEKEIANIAKEKWKMSEDNLQPLEDMMITDVRKGVTARERADVSGAVGLSTQKQFGQASTQRSTDMAAAGIDPTSGKYQESLSDLSRAGGETRSAAETEGEAGLQSAQMGDELNLLRIGSGQATQAQQSMSDVASRAASKAKTEADLAYQEDQGLRQLAGTVGGAAVGYYGTKKPMTDKDLAAKHGIAYQQG